MTKKALPRQFERRFH